MCAAVMDRLVAALSASGLSMPTPTSAICNCMILFECSASSGRANGSRKGFRYEQDSAFGAVRTGPALASASEQRWPNTSIRTPSAVRHSAARLWCSAAAWRASQRVVRAIRCASWVFDIQPAAFGIEEDDGGLTVNMRCGGVMSQRAVVM